MFNLRQVFAFGALFAFLVGFAGEVHAQTLPTAAPAVTLAATGVGRRSNRGGNLMNNQINFDDCNVNETIHFSLAVANPNSSLSLQVWAGASCEVLTNRQTTTQLTCHQIGNGMSVGSTSPPPIPVSIRDILFLRTQASAGLSPTATGTAGAAGTAGTGGTDATAGADTGGMSGSGGTAGAAGTAGASSSAGSAGAASTLSADEAACTPQDMATGAQTISVYFMLVDSGSVIQGTFAKWDATYKLLAPAPPDKVSASIGEGLLPITFSYTTPSTDNSINGYNFYCDPPPGADAAADAGVLPVDGGIALTKCNGVPSTTLVAGASVAKLGAYYCGSAGKSASGGNATGLVNGVQYNIAVATTDSYNNIGHLSPATCGVPQPVTGFYEAYRDAGGRGGGGFCSISRKREPYVLAALLGFAACLVLRRRRAA
jgi:hypothetical protein